MERLVLFGFGNVIIGMPKLFFHLTEQVRHSGLPFAQSMVRPEA